MAKAPLQDSAGIRVPPPLIFFAFLLVAGALEYWLALDYSRGPFIPRIAVALIALAVSGYLALHAFVVLKRRGTPVDPGKPTTQIVEEGPFRYSRNPLYLSLVLVPFAFSALFLSIWFFLSSAGLWLAFDRFAVRPEEAYLERKFGDRYAEYKSRVGRWV
ncbi:MAG: isoprenylcysteine carboxylmethyltransferase family protein [Elusimicrobiota bacterium]